MIRILARGRLALASLGLLLGTAPLTAQETGSIRGTITAADTKAPIYGARVSILNPERATTTDEKGAFTLRDLPAGTYDVIATGVGRQVSHNTVVVKGGAASPLDVALANGPLMLSGVTVSATRTPMELRQVAATINELTPEQVRTSPATTTQARQQAGGLAGQLRMTGNG